MKFVFASLTFALALTQTTAFADNQFLSNSYRCTDSQNLSRELWRAQLVVEDHIDNVWFLDGTALPKRGFYFQSPAPGENLGADLLLWLPQGAGTADLELRCMKVAGQTVLKTWQ